MSPEQAQATIDDFGIRLVPLVNRCKCGRRISDNRIACRACAMAALEEARKSEEDELQVLTPDMLPASTLAMLRAKLKYAAD